MEKEKGSLKHKKVEERVKVSLLARQLSLTAMALVNAYHIAYWLK